MKQKPPLFRCKELKPKRLRLGEKNECSSVCLHQPKSHFETLLVVKDSTSAIRRENIWLKTELEKTKDELKAIKDKMRKTILSVDTIRNNDKLCKPATLGFQTFVTAFPILLQSKTTFNNGQKPQKEFIKDKASC